MRRREAEIMKTKQAGSIWKTSSGLVGLGLMLVILVAANAIIRSLRIRADLTEENLYTLSDGTRAILDDLDSVVTIKFFFSSSAPEVPAPLKFFAREIEDLLREYEIAGRGKIAVEKHDPRPDTETEEWAERYGLFGQPLDMMGPRVYLGIVAVSGAMHEAIPFLDMRRQRLMEYDITRLVSRVSSPERPTLGVMSALPVMGDGPMPYAMPDQPQPRRRQPWIAFEELSQDYDMRLIEAGTGEIDPAIDVLIVVHPKDFSEETFFAIDQFVLRGGRLIAFLDPLSLTESFLARREGDPAHTKPASDLGPLPAAWGVSYEPEKILADLAASTPISSGRNHVEESPVFLTLRSENMNRENTVTAHLDSLMMAMAGVFSHSEPEGLSIEPLLTSSRQSQLIDSMAAQLGTEWIRRDFQSDQVARTLALRLHGHFTSAFPGGMPMPDNEDSDAGFLEESIIPGTVILVGDSDMLYDEFAVQEHTFFGQRAYQPVNDNINFLVNAVEQLAGGPSLIAVRARGRFERPFHRVLALQREAQERWLAEERALQQKLEITRERLHALEAERDASQRFILTPAQERELEQFRREKLKTQRELREVRRSLREDIERLGVKVKAFNILFVPALVCLAGLSFGYHRQRVLKRKRSTG